MSEHEIKGTPGTTDASKSQAWSTGANSSGANTHLAGGALPGTAASNPASPPGAPPPTDEKEIAKTVTALGHELNAMWVSEAPVIDLLRGKSPDQLSKIKTRYFKQFGPEWKNRHSDEDPILKNHYNENDFLFELIKKDLDKVEKTKNRPVAILNK